MIICAQKNMVICLPKREIKKITTGNKYVTVHYFGVVTKDGKVMSCEKMLRCHWVIVDGQKIFPNDQKTDDQFENEFAEIAALKERISKLEKSK